MKNPGFDSFVKKEELNKKKGENNGKMQFFNQNEEITMKEYKIKFEKIALNDVKMNFQTSIVEFSQLGLTETCKFLGELLQSIPKNENNEFLEQTNFISSVNPLIFNSTILFAKTLFDSREFFRSYEVLKNCFEERFSKKEGKLPNSFLESSKYASNTEIFMCLYMLYLHGEKKKLSESFERNSNVPINQFIKSIIYPSLKQIFINRNFSSETSSSTDRRGKAYLFYLMGIIQRRLKKFKKSQTSLLRCVVELPSLRCAWCELLILCKNNIGVFNDMDLSPFLENSFGVFGKSASVAQIMCGIFLCEFFTEINHSNCSKIFFEILKYLNEGFFNNGKKNPFFLQLEGLFFYEKGDFVKSEKNLWEMHEISKNRFEAKDKLSDVLFVLKNHKKLSILVENLIENDKFKFESSISMGNYYSAKNLHEKAILNFERGIKINPSNWRAWILAGHEYIEMKNCNAAILCYRKAIEAETNENDQLEHSNSCFRAWFGLGQCYELLNLHFYAIYYYRKAAIMKNGDQRRIWCCLGTCYEEVKRFDDAFKCYERAYDQMECYNYDSIDTKTALIKLARLSAKMKNYKNSAKYFSILFEFLEKKNEEFEEKTEEIEEIIDQLTPKKIQRNISIENDQNDQMEDSSLFKHTALKDLPIAKEMQSDPNQNDQFLKIECCSFLLDFFNNFKNVLSLDEKVFQKYFKFLEKNKNNSKYFDFLRRETKLVSQKNPN